MVVEIQDDFDLAKITMSGQCFRTKQFEDGVFRFIMGEHVIYLKQIEERKYDVSCDAWEWENIWYDYFDLNRNYEDIYRSECDKHEFVTRAINYGRGIRVLRQDPWEMLLTFIISQRKSIPAIAKAVEALAVTYGHEITTNYETIFTFPMPAELCDASAEELNGCSLGYRTPYILDAVKQVISGRLDLAGIAGYQDEDLFQELQNVYGVGKKVANCVCLFAYGRTARVPVDVWISRAIQEECGGDSPFELFGENAGIIQQYVFYYEKSSQQG